MTITSDWQVELGGVLTGNGTPYGLVNLEYEKPEGEVQDQPRPRGDGVLFGRDYLGGTLLNLEYIIVGQDAAEAFDLVEELRAAWQADEERNTSGATAVLTYRRPGKPDRRVFGRPRHFTPTAPQGARRRLIPVVCDFQARDHLFYDDAEQVAQLDQVSPESSGLVEPLVEPLSTEPFGEREGFVVNDGKAPAPVVVTFHGPATSPSLTLVGSNEVIKLDLTLAAGETVEVDTWTKTVLRDGVANVAGKLTRSSSLFHLPAGTSELRYAAVDATATSFAQVRFRNAHYSL